MSHERKILLLSLLIVGACAGLGIAFKSALVPVAPPAHAADEPAGRPPVEVSYVNPRIGNIRRAVRMAAEIKPDREAMIYGKVSGYVQAHPLEVGTRVDPEGKDGKQVLLKVAVPDLDAAVVTATSAVARAEAAKAEAGAAVVEAQQGVTEAEAKAKQVAGMRKAAEAGIQEARASYDLAKTIFERLTQVLEKSPNLVAQDRVDKARGELQVAQARVESAEVMRDKVRDDLRVAEARIAAARARVAAAEAHTAAAEAEHALATSKKAEAETRQGFATILAPFKGVIAERFVDTGDLVKDAMRNSGAMPLFRIVADDKVRVRFFISEPDAPMCKVGNRVELVVDVLDQEKPYVGTITRIADALDPKTRTMEVEAEMANPPEAGLAKLRSDMFARVKVFLEEHEGALLVPARCVRTKKRKSSVMVVADDGTVKNVEIQLGVDDGMTVQIKGGKIDASTKVVYTGRNLVAKGERVNAKLHKGGE